MFVFPRYFNPASRGSLAHSRFFKVVCGKMYFSVSGLLRSYMHIFVREYLRRGLLSLQPKAG